VNIACLCPTYNRPPAVLAEAIESFRRQDYPLAQRRLYVLNDCAGQTLGCDVPGVIVHNVSQRLTIGQKYNRMLAAASVWADAVVPWEDDDIYLPWALSYRAARLRDGPTWHTSRAWYVEETGQLRTCTNLHHCNLIARLDVLTAVGGWDERDRPDLDQELFRRLQVAGADIPPAEAWYIYRWGTTGSYHGSAAPAGASAMSQADRVAPVPGAREIVPRWSRDWLGLAKAAAEALT
jgi:glycosyltransferase involved in cell wall biosynthesis